MSHLNYWLGAIVLAYGNEPSQHHRNFWSSLFALWLLSGVVSGIAQGIRQSREPDRRKGRKW